jgi:hypothetical protein
MTMRPTLWCPSCGSEFVAGTLVCSDCQVPLTREQPSVATSGTAGGTSGDPGDDADLLEMGEFPRLHGQILRRRLESASIPVMLDPNDDGTVTLVVPAEHGDFAYAVINELDVEDEVPDTSPFAYVTRIEEHLAAAGALLDELRTRLEDLEADGRL